MKLIGILLDIARIFAPFIAVGVVTCIVYCCCPKFPQIFFPELGSEIGGAENENRL